MKTKSLVILICAALVGLIVAALGASAATRHGWSWHTRTPSTTSTTMGTSTIITLAPKTTTTPTTPSTNAPATTSTTTTPGTGIWHPALQTSWQWQLASVPTAPFIDVDVYDVDGFDTPASTVAAMKNDPSHPGRHVICYISAGTYENWRSDASQFPASVLGSNVSGWAGERWLDIRAYGGTLGQVMQQRFDMCKQKGFDAVEFDNVDGYTNNSGFPLTAQDQLNYNTWLAAQAHQRGLAAVLKNDVDQVPTLVSSFDIALNEQCYEYGECDNYKLFVSAGKAVFGVEYNFNTTQFCPAANTANFNFLKKNLSLDASRTPCRGN